MTKQCGKQMLMELSSGNGVDGLAQRHTRRKVEGQRHRGKHSLVIDHQRFHFVDEVRDAGKRHLHAICAWEVDSRQSRGSNLVFWLNFENDFRLLRRFAVG